MHTSIFQIISLSILVKITLGICPSAGKIEYGLSQVDIDLVVSEHNKYRQAVANGVYCQPAGVNLKRMKWHAGLAATAQEWANECTFQHNSNAVTVVGFNPIGQNLAWTGCTLDQRKPDFIRAIRMWFDEITNFIYPNGARNSSLPVGHYTQVVWANTEYVGCGYAYYKGPTFYEKLYVCNYGPAGNFIGQPPYLTTGQTTINCPNLC